MHEIELSVRERALLARLRELLAEGSAAEKRIVSTYEAARAECESRYKESRRSLKAAAESKGAQARAEYESLLAAIDHEFDATRSRLETEERRARTEASQAYEEGMEAARREHQEGRWETQTVYSATKATDREEFEKFEQELASRRQRIEVLVRAADDFLAESRLDRLQKEPPAWSTENLFVEAPDQKLASAMQSAAEALDRLAASPLPKLLKGWRVAALFVAAFAASSIVGALLLSPPVLALLAGLVGGGVFGGVAFALVHLAAKRQVAGVYAELLEHVGRAQGLLRHVHAEMAASYKARRMKLRKSNRKDLKEIDAKFRKAQEQLTEANRRAVAQCDESFPRLLAEATQKRDDAARAAREKYPPLIRAVKEDYERDSARIEEDHRTKLEEIERRRTEEWEALKSSLQAGLAEVAREIEAVQRRARELFPAWDGPEWSDWRPPTAAPPSIRFGEFDASIERLGAPTPQHEALRAMLPKPFTLPAVLGFPDKISTMLLASGEGLAEAGRALQAIAMRMLTSIPPGKVKFTIIDPVSLGQEFAALMHLADHDESLVNGRIWTESSHIEDRLADLTEHMENVIQKYLRNEYPTLEAYNADAEEVAEPYRVVVVSRFPVNFTEAAIRRLVSVLSAGARCGVYALMSVDVRQQLPHGTTLADLEKHSVRLQWSGSGFAWKDEEFGRCPLRVDAPPDPDFSTRVLGTVGRLGKEAGRVEVPFRVVIPSDDRFWTFDSRREVRIPLGRSGATKLQELELGRGTSQHVLVAGKTGAGKSTLLHALITSAALRYSPSEIEFYLIDFKKGVEFKTYATHALPHARVVAIESEREFGLSVMQRLDAELKIRGDKFRELGLQDVAGYRDLADRDPSLPPMPRILLVVDEFQEFFVADDRIAQDAALLLDRLVRQGRAFGVHVLLGSQTLGGAYSLARSTLGQMAVRIALQCSESDAHLILSEDNSAARLLSRPGEAIYNDANGRIEGNNVFQVVWLPDEEREGYLRRARELADARGFSAAEQIVFEGNVSADVRRNRLLAERLAAEDWPADSRRISAWLGEAVEIKEATSVEFPRQAGANLLIVGQQEEAAMSVLVSCLVSLAGQLPPADANHGSRGLRLYLLDGSLTDSPCHGVLERVGARLPHPVRVVTRRELPEAMAELQAEMERRQVEDSPNSPEVFLAIFDLGRIRDLRKNEDDFGFSSSADEGGAPKPERAFAAILKEGPAHGIHSIVWCDGLNNLNRTLDRASIKEFELRVLLQMSPTDSSNLIDNPAASRLGPNRAYFHHEDEGRLEKFRPYAAPDESWLDEVGRRLAARAALSAAAQRGSEAGRPAER